MRRIPIPIPLTATLCLAAAPRAGAGEFFPTRDENPLLRGFYLPLPGDSRRDAGAELAATLSVANTLNVERTARERLRVDGESDTLRLSYENSLAHDWRYRFTVPVIHDSGGKFDTVIDTWHQVLGVTRGNRPFFPKNQLVYSYSGRGFIRLDKAQTNLGDISAEAGWFAADSATHTVSLWAGVEAPTGSVANLTGDGSWDAALWWHAAARRTQWQLAAELGLAQPFGDEVFAGAAHRSSEFARAALTRALGPRWSLRAQLDGQTQRLSGSDMRLLGPSLQLTLGAVRRLAHNWRLECGFTEDAAVNTAPDITFFLGIHHQAVQNSGPP